MTDYKKIMLGISTRQNTANLVPILQYDFKAAILLETDFAKQQGWTEGLQQVLDNKNIDASIVSIGQGSDVKSVQKTIQQEISQAKYCHNEIWWNFGGGQKIQQLAMFQIFNERLATGNCDKACYADPGQKRIFEIWRDENVMKSLDQDVETEITLDDILTVFNLKKRSSNKPKLLWKRNNVTNNETLTGKKEAEIFWDTSRRQKLLAWILEPDGETPSELKGFKHGYADFFEKVVQFEVAQILEEKIHHYVTEAWANVRVRDAQNNEIAEWDIVLVTDFGTLVILDAKTGIFRQKDEHARLFNLEKATGYYGKFKVIIPYVLEDMKDDGFFAKQGEKGKDYRSIPLELNTLNSNFLGLTGVGESLYLQKWKKRKHRLSKTCPEGNMRDNRTIVKIRSHYNLLDDLMRPHELDTYIALPQG